MQKRTAPLALILFTSHMDSNSMGLFRAACKSPKVWIDVT